MYGYCAEDENSTLFISETKVDPFTYCTIAASVMAVY